MSKKPIKNVWGALSVKLSVIISSVLIVLLVAALCVAMLNSFIYGTISLVLGGERRVLVEGTPELLAEYTRFTTEYEGKEDVLADANKLNEKIVGEGITLMKNDGDLLPLAKSSKVTVFGKNSVDIITGGSGSSAGRAVAGKEGIYDSLEAAGISCNPEMREYYRNEKEGKRAPTQTMGSVLTGLPTGEAPVSATAGYGDSLESSFEEYGDAALVVISRTGGEGFDMPRTMFYDASGSGDYTNWDIQGTDKAKVIPGARSADDHYLELDQNEENLVRYASSKFENVILVINSSSPLELGFLKDGSYGNVKSAVWIGHTGGTGINAFGKVIAGEINPSGRTVDTYTYDFTTDPAYQNFGNNKTGDGNAYRTSENKKDIKKAYMVEYEEGIYVGYRYYETRAVEETADGNSEWYDDNVVYPFGYGLSYTDFTQEIIDCTPSDGGTLAEDGTISVTVRVTNNGEREGKEVVQLYQTAPYYENGIEKAHVTLVGFAKTDTLQPDAHEDVTVTVKVSDLASYDWNDANGNGFKGYELEGGNYQLKVMKNAHEVIDSVTYTVPETEDTAANGSTGYVYDIDSETKYEVKNRFDDVGIGDDAENPLEYMSRADFEGTFPETVTTQELIITQQFLNTFTYKVNDKSDDPWYSATAPSQQSSELTKAQAELQLYDMFGLEYDDPKWDELLNQLTVQQIKDFVIKACYNTITIDTISKPSTYDGDGPVGHSAFMGAPHVFDVCYYASETVMGATWNVELAKAFGEMIGDEALIGDAEEYGRAYTGWYAPAVNIHRSQFSGRNYEYYSEDGLLSGKLAANVVTGARSRGLITYVKHFALNDQETNRDSNGLFTWANEQSMRELYFVPFEIAVKEGNANGIMSSFNRLGVEWAGGSYDLLTEVLRNEWGFVGAVITDFNLSNYMSIDQMIRAGGDLSLSTSKSVDDEISSTALTQFRRAAKNGLYVYANSNAMNGYGDGVEYGWILPAWSVVAIVLVVVICVLCIGWCVLTILLARKRLLKKSAENTDGKI